MKRGKILRDPRAGPGLLMIEGRQYWFSMEGVWKSEVPPKPGLAVDVKLDRADKSWLSLPCPNPNSPKNKRNDRWIRPKRRG
jgi:hypothetical protein